MRKILKKILLKKIERSFLLIDKESGITSHDEVFRLRKLLTGFFDKKIKTGHSGTLDPKVSGLLVCGISKGTKLMEYMLLSQKIYQAEFIFHKNISKGEFEKAIKVFTGKIKQLPPVKSAVKRVLREREIYEIKILNFNERRAELFLRVEKGTYIRKLAHDMGVFLNKNISMGNLRRLGVSVFSIKEDKVLTFKEMEKNLKKFEKNIFFSFLYFLIIKKYLYSFEKFFKRLSEENKIKIIKVKKEYLYYLKNGSPARVKNLSKKYDLKKGELVALFYKNKFLAIGKVKNIDFKNEENELIYIEKNLIS